MLVRGPYAPSQFWSTPNKIFHILLRKIESGSRLLRMQITDRGRDFEFARVTKQWTIRQSFLFARIAPTLMKCSKCGPLMVLSTSDILPNEKLTMIDG